MNMKIIIMSATLPDLSQLVDGKCNVVKLIRNPEKYTLHPTFANRVICNYELLQEEELRWIGCGGMFWKICS